jgi:2-amino-4-hydroxy-6-hydroxymethyldihydropteridine diphosphokinase
MTTEILLVLGSNTDPEQQLTRAVAALASAFELRAVTSRHWSPAAGTPTAAPYLNQAAWIATELRRETLKLALREIEARLGRQRPSNDPSRCAIDIDAVAQLRPWSVWDRKCWDADYFQPLLPEIKAWFADTPATIP